MVVATISATAAGIEPAITLISPEQGKEGMSMVIQGKNFGSRGDSINTRRYVDFNGFLGTEILRWEDSAIEIKTPRLGAVADEQKETATDIISWIPVVKDIAKMPLKLMPIRVAKSPEELGTRATITVMTPNGRSNEVHFYYVHEDSSEKTNLIWDTAKLIGTTFFREYVVKPLNTILHPINAIQKKTERISRTIINDSVIFTTDYNKNKEATKTPPAQIGDAVKDILSNETAKQKSAEPTKSSEGIQRETMDKQAATITKTIPRKITAYVTDQYGNPFGTRTFGYSPEYIKILRDLHGNAYESALPFASGGHFELYDALGEQIMTGHIFVKDGYLESPELPPGKYTLIIPQRPTSNKTPVVKNVELPAEGITLGTLKVMHWGAVRVKVTNEVGTEIGARLVLKKCEITDQQVKEADANRYPKNAPSECARLNNNSVPWNLFNGTIGVYPPGNYTVEISNSSYGTIEKSFSVNNRDVDLGTIILRKQSSSQTTEQSKDVPAFPNLNGIWDLTWRDKTFETGSSQVEIAQASGDKKFSGKGTQTYNGQTLSFTITGEVTNPDANGRNLSFIGDFGSDTVNYNGTAVNNRIDGSWKNALSNSGTFTMTRR